MFKTLFADFIKTLLYHVAFAFYFNHMAAKQVHLFKRNTFADIKQVRTYELINCNVKSTFIYMLRNYGTLGGCIVSYVYWVVMLFKLKSKQLRKCPANMPCQWIKFNVLRL